MTEFKLKDIRENQILVRVESSLASRYSGLYDADLCVGEVIRNVCVNLGIDPDTQDGYTKNVNVFVGESSDTWDYDPNTNLSVLGFTQIVDGHPAIHLRIEPALR